MSEALEQVWRRAEIRDHTLNAAELAGWMPDERDAILTLGLLRRTADATVLMCEDCGSPHAVEVIRDPRRPEEPYYICPEIGRVTAEPEDLYLWEVDFDALAAALRKPLGLKSKAATIVTSRIWLAGRQLTENGYWELFLMRGLCWPDGRGLLSQCARLQQSPAAIVVVPYRLPPGENPATSWPIRTLAETVRLDGSTLVVDLPTLTTAVGALGIRPVSSNHAPRKRMSRSLGTPEAVRAVTQYLEHTQMTDTQFGIQFQTTDKTVRTFRRSGKVRRSTFEAMAKSMGLTTDQLLRGELAHSVKQSTPR